MSALCGPHFLRVFAKINHEFRIGRNLSVFTGKIRKNTSTETTDFLLDVFSHIRTSKTFTAARTSKTFTAARTSKTFTVARTFNPPHILPRSKGECAEGSDRTPVLRPVAGERRHSTKKDIHRMSFSVEVTGLERTTTLKTR